MQTSVSPKTLQNKQCLCNEDLSYLHKRLGYIHNGLGGKGYLTFSTMLLKMNLTGVLKGDFWVSRKPNEVMNYII